MDGGGGMLLNCELGIPDRAVLCVNGFQIIESIYLVGEFFFYLLQF